MLSFDMKSGMKAFIYLVSCLLLTLSLTLSGCGTPPRPIARPDVSSVVAPDIGYGTSVRYQNLYHEVGPMETLWRIAKAYDVDINAVMQVNRIGDPNKIKVGQKILIPYTKGLRPVIPLYKTRPWGYIVIHHTATETGNAISINAVHHRRGFWDGLGYHFLIDNGTLGKLDGQMEISPRWVKQQDGAHCNAAGMNQNGIGIALVGNFSESRVTERQLDSLVFLTSTLMKHYQIPLNHVLRHGDVPGKNTECPGLYFPWQEFVRRLAQALK